MENEQRLDLIDRQALGIGRCNPDAFPLQNRGYVAGWNGVIDLLEQAPRVDAVEVVHARWENGHCTNCTHYAEVQNIGFTCTGEVKVNYKHTNYCPNCGAIMDGGNEDG